MSGDRSTQVRRRGAVVLVIALLAGLLGVSGIGAQPAPAPDTSAACDHVGSAGFTDIAGTGFEDLIDCLAAFGVTAGTTPTTYSPAVQVRRSQMALFYYRIGQLAGVSWDTSAAGFTDLGGGLGADFVDAINALANAGIVQGTSATEFSPQDRIRRSQMALFIDRFQEHAFGTAYSDGIGTDDLFPDISGLSAEARDAVNGIGSVGITQGDAAGNYVPSGFVSRQQMAAFIVRHLAENGLVAPGPSVTGMLVEYTSGSDYVVSTGTQLVTVDIEAGDSFSIEGTPATEGAFEGELATSSSGLGHHIAHDPVAGSHNMTPRDDAELVTLGLTIGDDLDLTTSPLSASLVEPISNVVIVASSDLGWGGVTTYRIGATTVTATEFRDDISFGDTLVVAESGSDRTFTLTNRSFNGVLGDEADISPPDPGVDIAIVVDYGEFVTGNDLEGGQTYVLSDAAYSSDEQVFVIGSAQVDYDSIEDFLVNGTSEDTIAELIDDGLEVRYRRSGDTETFTFLP